MNVFNQTIEWNRFIDYAEQEAFSEPAKQRVLLLKDMNHWAEDLNIACLLQSQTKEIFELGTKESLWSPLLELKDLSFIFEQLRKNAVLDLQQMIALRDWLYAVDSWVQFPKDEISEGDFRKALNSLYDPFLILRQIDKVITPEGRLSENASPLLKSLADKINSYKKQIDILMADLVQKYSKDGLLQEKFTDERDGRYVLPVKISCQSKLDGIIYGTSVSHQTAFIEPKEVELLNNQLKKCENDYQQEVYRILKELSELVGEEVDDIFCSYETLTYWDSVHAKVKISNKCGGKPIRVVEDRCFDLNSTAHPLLWWSLSNDEIVRNDISFSYPALALLLTGPNTGGKTVLLKTLAFAGICARTGFMFPGVGTLSVPFFDTFFVDLGDPQSIEDHISSFSGHVEHVKNILENKTKHSLVLIDEMNSATDPEEGAAFSRAFLEVLLKDSDEQTKGGAMIVITTHDPYLKSLAFNDQRILNASMAFDEEKDVPTYDLLIGVPGRSRALETAKRLGVSNEVLDLAKSYLSSEHNVFEKLIRSLQEDTLVAEKAKKEAVKLRNEAYNLEQKWNEKSKKSLTEMMDRLNTKLRRTLLDAQDEVKRVLSRLGKVQTRKDVDEVRKSLNESFRMASDKLDLSLRQESPELAEVYDKKNAPTKEVLDIKYFKKDMVLRLPKWNSLGVVQDVMNKNIMVRLGLPEGGSKGGMVLKVLPSEVEVLSEEEVDHLFPNRKRDADALKGKGQVHQELSFGQLSSTLDLRGERFDAAMEKLESYLDKASLSHYSEVTIVHGVGTGAIREGVLNLLKTLPYIQSFEQGGPGRGGAGATIVLFDRS